MTVTGDRVADVLLLFAVLVTIPPLVSAVGRWAGPLGPRAVRRRRGPMIREHLAAWFPTLAAALSDAEALRLHRAYARYTEAYAKAFAKEGADARVDRAAFFEGLVPDEMLPRLRGDDDELTWPRLVAAIRNGAAQAAGLPQRWHVMDDATLSVSHPLGRADVQAVKRWDRERRAAKAP